MMNFIRTRLAAILIMALLCAVAILYIDGFFDIAMIVRGNDKNGDETDTAMSDTEPDTETDTEPPDTSTDVGTDTGTDIGTEEITDTETAQPDTTPAEFEPMEFAAAEELGYELSYDEWTPGGDWTLADVIPGDIQGDIQSDIQNFITLPGYFSSRYRAVRQVSYERTANYSPYVPVYTEVSEKKPAVELYMGYILVEADGGDNDENNNTVNIYTSVGVLAGSYDAGEITPAYCRDKDDNPLFLYKDAYYRLNVKSGKFVLSDYVPQTDSRGVRFDYTPDYGDDSGSRTFVSVPETVDVFLPIEGEFDDSGAQLAHRVPTLVYKFALADKNRAPMTEYLYTGAFPFSESRAAVLNPEGFLYYITRSGSTAIRTGKTRRDLQLGRTVFDFYALPISDGEESIGFIYFEHGLVRAHLMSLDYYRYDKDKTVYVVSDAEVMLYTNGERFDIPTGYKVEAYSCGMILLSRNGKYGYMDYTGRWVVQPTLISAEPFYEGLAVVGDGTDVGVIDTDGGFVIPYGVYSYISNASTGVVAAYSDNKAGWSILYKMEK